MWPFRSRNKTLTHAVLAGNLRTVRKMLRNGADPNRCDSVDGRTPLHCAVKHGLEMVRLLLDNHAEINSYDAHGRTPLVIAEECGYGEVASILRKAGARSYPKDLAQGIHFMLLHDWDSALRHFDQAIASDPDCCPAHLNRGTVLLKLGKADQGIASLDRAIKLDARNRECWFIKAEGLFHGLKRFDEAAACYEKAGHLGHARAREMAGVAKRQALLHKKRETERNVLGKLDTSTTDDERRGLMEQYRDQVQLLNAGIQLGKENKWAEAAAMFDAALTINPKYSEALSNRGMALAKLGKHDEALNSFREAVRIDPQDAELWANLGIHLYNQGEVTEAIKHFEQARALGFEDAGQLIEQCLRSR